MAIPSHRSDALVNFVDTTGQQRWDAYLATASDGAEYVRIRALLKDQARGGMWGEMPTVPPDPAGGWQKTLGDSGYASDSSTHT